VVRTAPNELSFNTQGSWKDIYGFRQGHKPFIKSDFYDGGSFAAEAHSIVSERDPVEHGKMRKYLAHAFSDRSLKEQEYLITEIVDKFIDQIGKHGRDGLDLVMWFNLATFDIIGSLAFGEPFGGVASGRLAIDTFLRSYTFLKVCRLNSLLDLYRHQQLGPRGACGLFQSLPNPGQNLQSVDAQVSF